MGAWSGIESMYAVNLNLKVSNFSTSRILFGSVFYKCGANTVKELSYKVWYLAFVDFSIGGMVTETPLLSLYWVRVICDFIVNNFAQVKKNNIVPCVAVMT